MYIGIEFLHNTFQFNAINAEIYVLAYFNISIRSYQYYLQEKTTPASILIFHNMMTSLQPKKSQNVHLSDSLFGKNMMMSPFG